MYDIASGNVRHIKWECMTFDPPTIAPVTNANSKPNPNANPIP